MDGGTIWLLRSGDVAFSEILRRTGTADSSASRLLHFEGRGVPTRSAFSGPPQAETLLPVQRSTGISDTLISPSIAESSK